MARLKDLHMQEHERGSMIEGMVSLSRIVVIVSHTCLCCRERKKKKKKKKKKQKETNKVQSFRSETKISLDQNASGPGVVVICDAPIFLISTKAPNTIVNPEYCSSSLSRFRSEMCRKTPCRVQHF